MCVGCRVILQPVDFFAGHVDATLRDDKKKEEKMEHVQVVQHPLGAASLSPCFVSGLAAEWPRFPSLPCLRDGNAMQA